MGMFYQVQKIKKTTQIKLGNGNAKPQIFDSNQHNFSKFYFQKHQKNVKKTPKKSKKTIKNSQITKFVTAKSLNCTQKSSKISFKTEQKVQKSDKF